MENKQETIALGIAEEKGRIIREALLIIDKLAGSNIADIDTDDDSIEAFGEREISELKELIIRARTIKHDRWWKNTINPLK